MTKEQLARQDLIKGLTRDEAVKALHMFNDMTDYNPSLGKVLDDALTYGKHGADALLAANNIMRNDDGVPVVMPPIPGEVYDVERDGL